MKKAVKGQALVSMDALVQEMESTFTVGVLHFPLPGKFKMLQIEAFDGTKDPVDHLNTYRLRGSCTDTRTLCDVEPLPSR